MTPQDVLDWLYAIETFSDDALDTGDWEAQDFGLEWFSELRRYYGAYA